MWMLLLALSLLLWSQPAYAVSVTWKDMSSAVCSGNTTKDCQESYFVVERKGPTGAFVDVGHTVPDAQQFTDSQVTPGTTYTWRIKAVNGTGSSAYSNEVTFLVPALALGVSRLTCSSGVIPPLSGLVLSSHFNEGAGTVTTDTSGNNNTGTLSGPTWTTQGKYGAALVFDGVNDTVAVPDAPSLNLTSKLTLEAWVYPTAATVTGWHLIMQKETGPYYLAAWAEGKPAISAHLASGWWDLYGPALALNTWTHVAATYNGATMLLYLNGVQVASRALTGAITTDTKPLRIGSATATAGFFQGRIDEVRMYNRALSAAEILADMNTP